MNSSEPAPVVMPKVQRVRVDLAYDGGEYAGWASQPGLPTVQGSVESVITAMYLRARVSARARLTCAGRTDAGVHARGQVCHLDVPQGVWQTWGPPRFMGQLNAHLPADIRVRAATAAPSDFDARFSALSRTYTYRICDDPRVIDPVNRGSVMNMSRRLDITAMNQAALPLIGENDFAAFCRRRPGASTIRRILGLEWKRFGDSEVIMTVESDAFCHSMVRSLVGALVAVGERRRDPSWLADLLSRDSRSPDVLVMPPHGLVLEHVAYPSAERVGSQAAAARIYRGQSESPVH